MQHLEVSCAVRPIEWPLGVKWLKYMEKPILPFVLCGCKIWCLTLREGIWWENSRMELGETYLGLRGRRNEETGERNLRFVRGAKKYTGCHRRNGQNFGRVFHMLNYTYITQNTYIQSWMVTEIMAREKCGLLGCPRTVRRPWRHTHPLRMPGNETPLANIVM